jgi:hypothetical protein
MAEQDYILDMGAVKASHSKVIWIKEREYNEKLRKYEGMGK